MRQYVHVPNQAGFTLIELMIALALGVLISFSIISILLSSNRNAQTSESESDVHETGRFAITIISKAIRNAGYSPSGAITAFESICVDPDSPTKCTLNTADAFGDQIAIRRIATPGNDKSCFGSSMGLGSATEVTDVFWVEYDESLNMGNLRCQTFEQATSSTLTNAQSLVAGVEAIHVLYGVRLSARPDQKRNVSAYVPAENVTNWNDVLAVKIAVLTRSTNEFATLSSPQDFILLDSNPYSLSDGISRAVYSTTVTRPTF